VQQLYRYFFRQKAPFGFFMAGMTNGLLPCGLVYVALGTASLSASAAAGAWLMAWFGLGTMPLLLGVGLLQGWLRRQTWLRSTYLSTLYLVSLALLLLLRGWQSPLSPQGSHQAPLCRTRTR
jgi:sulfite exporter TauE/SafE